MYVHACTWCVLWAHRPWWVWRSETNSVDSVFICYLFVGGRVGGNRTQATRLAVRMPLPTEPLHGPTFLCKYSSFSARDVTAADHLPGAWGPRAPLPTPTPTLPIAGFGSLNCNILSRSAWLVVIIHYFLNLSDMLKHRFANNSAGCS